MSIDAMDTVRTRQPSKTLMKKDVVIVGSSISGLMTACYLKQKLPQLQVLVVGPPPEQEKRASVGESLTEISIHFFWEIGLKEYLDQTHDRKNGLTFYHKLRIDDPNDYRYSVHAPGEQLYYHSRQLNRPIFDCELRTHAAQMGVDFLIGQATDIQIGTDQMPHQIQVKTATQERVQLSAKWIVDATGQKRLIGKQVTHYHRPPDGQRSAFWFRLANFQNLLPQLELSMRRPHDYDLWHSTHHFMGHANWIWCIPLQSNDHDNLVSIGLTYRPDLYPNPLHTMDDFLTAVEREHPAIATMVRSGQVLDIHTYRNYLYSANQVYSTDNWFLVGNAARTVDPLYSTGLAMTALQIQQFTEIIQRQLNQTLRSSDIEVLSSLWCQLTARRQVDITDQYVTMHDPFSSHLRRYWNLNGWWNAILPLWWNGFLTDPKGARSLMSFVKGGTQSDPETWALFNEASKQAGAIEPKDMDQTFDFDQIINRRFDQSIHSIPQQLSNYFAWRLQMRFNLMQRLDWQKQLHQLRWLIQDLAKMLAIRYFFRLKFRALFKTIRPPLSFNHVQAAQQDHIV